MSDDDNAWHARIEARAYRLWTESGMPEGRAEDFWHLAKAQIEDEERPASVERAQVRGDDQIPPGLRILVAAIGAAGSRAGGPERGRRRQCSAGECVHIARPKPAA